MDRAEHICELWRKYGYVMFPQQRAIYRQIAKRLDPTSSVIEAGCGDGIGGSLLATRTIGGWRYTGTDIDVSFAKALHPGMDFDVWNIEEPYVRLDKIGYGTVVAVEVIEHVSNVKSAIDHLKNAPGIPDELWLSTPNGRNKTDNPHHVHEYTPAEMLDLIGHADVLHWETFEPAPLDTDVTPLVYHWVRK